VCGIAVAFEMEIEGEFLHNDGGASFCTESVTQILARTRWFVWDTGDARKNVLLVKNS
jgi:hypothetical protein